MRFLSDLPLTVIEEELTEVFESWMGATNRHKHECLAHFKVEAK